MGSEMCIRDSSNTFATLKSALQDAGLEKYFDAYNRRGVELACEARAVLSANTVVVAGGISHWSWSGNHPTLEELRDNATDQAAIMKEAGADLIMLEMMVNVEAMLAVLDGVQDCGLPIWVGLSCKLDSNGTPRLYDGDKTIGEQTLADAIDILKGRNVPLLNIMHTEVSYIDACLNVVEDMWSGLVGVYAHSGNYIDGKWIFCFRRVVRPRCDHAHGIGPEQLAGVPNPGPLRRPARHRRPKLRAPCHSGTLNIRSMRHWPGAASAPEGKTWPAGPAVFQSIPGQTRRTYP